jgi:FkbM family methyltransferase
MLPKDRPDSPSHHPIFGHFDCWEGEVLAGFSTDFLGMMTQRRFAGWPDTPGHVRTTYPPFNEEYFEWVDLLESVLEAREQFTMIELGAGFGRWLARGAIAAQYRGGLPYRLVGVEAEPDHFRWMKVHFEDNRVDLTRCTMIEAAVAGKDGSVGFTVGSADTWYGQAVVNYPSLIESFSTWVRKAVRLQTRANTIPPHRVRKVRAVSLASLLGPLEKVDLIDLDVQGAELEVLTAAPVPLREKVKRVHVGTHSGPIENCLRTFFRQLGWDNRNDYSCGQEQLTPYGRIAFQDGVQTWVNPRIPA